MLYIYWKHVRYPGLECHLVFTVIAGDCFSSLNLLWTGQSQSFGSPKDPVAPFTKHGVLWLQCYFVGETLSQPSDLSRWVIHTLLKIVTTHFSPRLFTGCQLNSGMLIICLPSRIYTSIRADAVHLFITVGQCLAHGRGQEILCWETNITQNRTFSEEHRDQSSTDVNIAFFTLPPSFPSSSLELLLLFFFNCLSLLSQQGFPTSF